MFKHNNNKTGLFLEKGGSMATTAGLYIHIPFCAAKCPYCDFYSLSADDTSIHEYTNIVCKTLLNYSKKLNLRFDTLYFGGGTPSLLGNENLAKILETVRENFDFSEKEITLEMNPTTLPDLDLEKLRKDGINRLSIGVQSAVKSELKVLGRRHSVKDVEHTIKKAQNAGFKNISLDLMVAIPEQTVMSLKETIAFCAEQNVQHISAYILKIEQCTPFYKNKENLQLKTEDEQADMYLTMVSEMEHYGFEQYEISNFAKKNYASKHNLKYWNSKEYLGIGPSAHSFVNGERFFYPRSLQDFLAGKIEPIKDSNGGTIEEYTMLKLRLCDGISNNDFKRRFGVDVPQSYFRKAKIFQNYGLTAVDRESIRLTPKGFLLSNKLISEIIF